MTAGLFASNLGGSDLDLTISDSRTRRGQQSSYDAWYVSVGRSVGARAYLTGDFSTSLSILHVTPTNGFQVETRPRTSRIGLSSVINVGRSGSVLATFEATRDGTITDLRTLVGLTWRF